MSKQSALERIGTAKENWDKAVAEIDLRARIAKEDAKQAVYAALREGLAEGLSVNAIAVRGMGYRGVSPLYAFARATPQTVDGLTAAINAPAKPIEAVSVGTSSASAQNDEALEYDVEWDGPVDKQVRIHSADFEGRSQPFFIDRKQGDDWTAEAWQFENFPQLREQILAVLEKVTGHPIRIVEKR